ncbi:helix-turn-helix domain-containing protein [Flagellimonas meishanensis]|uniref:helix-turn-helix domain-containing protein n=1 Tax=Flagellimonas meishanensis TaxID=2873264 RepID=UPI001CA6D6DE|nr:AraC family transcriptional regulator [[Muricauda] meishanensis]
MEVEIKKGEINGFNGKKVDGKVLFSNLIQFKARSFTNCYSLKFVFHGTEHYIINGERKTVHSNQFLLVPPGQELETRINAKGPVKGVCVYFSEDTFEQQLDRYATDLPIVPGFPISSSFLQVPDVFSSTTIDAQWANPDFFLESTLAKLIPFLAHSTSKLRKLEVKKEDTRYHLWEKMEKGRVFIEKHYSAKLSLDQIAKEACLSPFHFQKRFKGFYGKSPNKYLNEIRIQRAQELFNQGYKPAYIAEQCGFGDAHYLQKCLKKQLYR